MPRKPRHNPTSVRPEGEDSWEEDQRDQGYYYDDAHGYETFDPDDDNVDSEHENQERLPCQQK